MKKRLQIAIHGTHNPVDSMVIYESILSLEESTPQLDWNDHKDVSLEENVAYGKTLPCGS